MRCSSHTGRAALASLIVSLGLAGCPRRGTPFARDSGPEIDGPPIPTALDTDGDGLCDPQEASRGTRVDRPDTDDDGYSDLVEVSLGFDPLRPASPDRDGIVILDERAGATARATMVATITGMGETYNGAFSSARQAFEDGQSAAQFYESAQVIGAEPMESVFSLEGERAYGVEGRSRLVYEIRFAFDAPVLGCARAYPFVYQVKREDARIVAQQRFTLVIRPSEDAPWCSARPCW